MAASTSGFIYTPSHFLGWALDSGWQPKSLPVGVIYTFQAPVARAIAEESERFAENTDLTVSNARMYMTRDEGPPVMVACLNPGGASLAAQLENLRFLGDDTRFAAVVGTAGALTPEFRIGETVIVSSALRTDAISDKYLPPAPVVDADATFVDALGEAMGSTTQHVRTWTVPVPYRSTRQDLDEARDAGAKVVEMEIATLFAVCKALEIRAAAGVVISDAHRVDNWEVDWSDTTQPTVDAVLSTIAVIRRMATS